MHRPHRLIPLIAAAGAIAACAADPGVESPAAPMSGIALRNAAGEQVGTVHLAARTDGSQELTLAVAGFAPGTYGTHIHTVGLCEGPAFASAGGHWNPTNRQHGRLNPQGTHQGDLPNLIVGADGEGTISLIVPASDPPLFDADGASVMVHAGPDDERSDPAGNSGGRIACAVLTQG